MMKKKGVRPPIQPVRLDPPEPVKQLGGHPLPGGERPPQTEPGQAGAKKPDADRRRSLAGKKGSGAAAESREQ